MSKIDIEELVHAFADVIDSLPVCDECVHSSDSEEQELQVSSIGPCCFCETGTAVAECCFCGDSMCQDCKRFPNVIQCEKMFKEMHIGRWQARLSDKGWQRYIKKINRYLTTQKRTMCIDCVKKLQPKISGGVKRKLF